MFWWWIELLFSPKGSHWSQPFWALSLFSRLLLPLGKWTTNTNDRSLIFILANFKRMSCVPQKRMDVCLCLKKKRGGVGNGFHSYSFHCLAFDHWEGSLPPCFLYPVQGLSILMKVMGWRQAFSLSVPAFSSPLVWLSSIWNRRYEVKPHSTIQLFPGSLNLRHGAI